MSVTNQEIQQWLSANPTATDKDIRSAMEQHGVSTKQMAEAAGLGHGEVQSRYMAAYSPPATTTPATDPNRKYSNTNYGNNVSNTEVYDWLAANPKANDHMVAAAMDSHNVSVAQMADARGLPVDEVQRRYDATKPKPHVIINSGKPTTPAQPQYQDPFDINSYMSNLMLMQQQQNDQNKDLFQMMMERQQSASQPKSVSQPQQATPNLDRQVTDPEVVEKRVASIMERGHPLLEQAKNQTLASFSSRGLLNSSVAVQAAQEAMLSKAYEIASQDANTFNRQGMANQSFQNEFAGREQVQGFTRENQYNDYLYNQGLMNAEYGNRGNLAAFESGLRGNLLERELSLRNQFDVEGEGRRELATSRERYQTTLQNYQADYQNQYQNIVMAADMDEESKGAAIQNLNDRYSTMFDNANSIYEKIPGWEQEWLVVRA